jgi:pSer/pThr/pTyr-binding forkhead associated (FHA) protein
MDKSYRITVTNGDETFAYTLTESEVVIGRSSSCTFSIQKDNLSRQHCQINIEEDGYYITDLGSKNGTAVNREKIPPHTKVRFTSADFVTIANHYTLHINVVEIKTKADIAINRTKTGLQQR